MCQGKTEKSEYIAWGLTKLSIYVPQNPILDKNPLYILDEKGRFITLGKVTPKH